MSTVATCPTCGSQSKIKEKEGKVTFQAIQDDELLKKVSQLKKAMETFKGKAEALEEEIKNLKSKL